MTETTMLAAGDRYETLKRLGEGGMGAVYLVADRVRGEQLALKVLAEPGGVDEASYLRFKQEFRAMAGLVHPNTCAVYDFGRLPDATPYFTMEVVPGRDLLEGLPADADERLALIGQLLLALGYVHQQGFVHCDLKPENIRVKPDGTVKLMDFGLMAASGQALEAVRGTLAYVSPEVAKRARIDQRSDLYSLGAVLYELLAGQPPFRSTQPLQLLRAHLTEAPPPLREVNPEVPEKLAAVVMKLLAKEPQARYQSAREVMAALGLDAGSLVSEGLLSSPFVGREAELGALEAALGRLQAERQGGVIKLVGAAGMGTGRLLEEFRIQVQLAELPYLAGECPQEPLPYGPWVPVLRGLVARADAALVQELAVPLGRLLPELAKGESPKLEPDQEKLLIQSAIARLLVAVTAPDGGVVAFEDWHRADPLSLEALSYVLRNAPVQAGGRMPMVTILAGHDPAAVEGETLTLAGLGREEVRTMLAAMLGQARIPDALLDQLMELTGGNPRLASAALEHAVSTGAIARQRDGWSLPEKLDPGALATDVRKLLEDRLGRLPESVRAAARELAVLGSGFDLAHAVEVLGLDEDVLFDALAALVQARVLDAAGKGYRFVLPELASILAEELTPERERALHLTAATALEAHLPAQGEPPLDMLDRIARHLVAAGDAVRAIPRVTQTVQRFGALYAYTAASALLEASQQLLDALPDTEDQLAVRADYLRQQASNYNRLNLPDKGLAAIQACVATAERMGDRERRLGALSDLMHFFAMRGTAEASRNAVSYADEVLGLARELGNWGVFARVALNLIRPLVSLGEPERAKARGREALEAAEKAGQPLMVARALSRYGHLLSGDVATREEGLDLLTRAEAMQAEHGDKYGQNFSRGLLGDFQLESGRLVAARATFESQLPFLRELSLNEDLAVALVNLGLTSREQGQHPALVASLDEMVSLGKSGNIGELMILVPALRVAPMAESGQWVEAAAQLRDLCSRMSSMAGYVQAVLTPILVDAWLSMGCLDTALALTQEALFSARGDERYGAQLALFLAEIYAGKRMWDQAQQHLASVMGSGLFSGSRTVQARALRLQATVALGRGDVDAALAGAEQAQAIAGQEGLLPQQVRLAGLVGECALAGAKIDATAPFQTMQALADQIDAPLLRAQALFGQAQANPMATFAAGLIAEAQRVVKDLTSPLDEALRQEILAAPAVAAIMAADSAARPAAATALEGSRKIGERFSRMKEDLVGLATQYELLFEDWQASNMQLRKLNDLATRMNESLHLEEVLQQVVALTLEITKAERGFIVLKSQDRYENLVGRAAFDQFGKPLPENSFSLSITHKVLAADKAIAILDASEDAAFASAKSVIALDIKTVMGTPLIAKGKRLGVLYVDSQAVVTTFTEKDLELLRAIASHASVAIENATLYEALDLRARELEAALEKYRRAETEANTDVLTGLANRRAFHDLAAKELAQAQRFDRPLSVIMLDVDHFKKFNDTYGHAVGDEVLKAMGRVLPAAVRVGDTPARLGGEEFVVLCPSTAPEEARAVAERIREAVLEVKLNDQEGNPVRQITASLGVAQILSADAGIDAALERADIALYACKRGGRNQSQIWSAEMPPGP